MANLSAPFEAVNLAVGGRQGATLVDIAGHTPKPAGIHSDKIGSAIGTSVSPAPAAAAAKRESSRSKSCTSFELAAISPLLTAGFRAVLAEASKLGVLDPPHGRTPVPDPAKLVEDDPFVSRGRKVAGPEQEKDSATEAEGDAFEGYTKEHVEDNDVDDVQTDDDTLLDYKFDYGFNPLVFLGNFLRKNNPATIQAKKKKHDADLAYLRRRAAKSLGRERVLVELQELVAHRRTGVVHGPIVGEVSDCGGIFWARTFRSGQFMVELSRHEDFRTVCRQGSCKVEPGSDCTALVEFDDLEPNTRWHHRTYLHNPRKGFDGPAAGFSVKGKFSTLPERDIHGDKDLCFVALSMHGLGNKDTVAEDRSEVAQACSAIAAAAPHFCVALGDPSPAAQSSANFLRDGFGDFHETTARMPEFSLMLRTYGFLTAGGVEIKATAIKRRKEKQHKLFRPKRGSSRAEGAIVGALRGAGGTRSETEGLSGGGVAGLGAEEERPPVPPDWPLRCPEAWGSRVMGSGGEVFLTDARSGSIGDDQLAWLIDAVEESRRTWKIIACGVPVACSMSSAETRVLKASTEALGDDFNVVAEEKHLADDLPEDSGLNARRSRSGLPKSLPRDASSGVPSTKPVDVLTKATESPIESWRFSADGERMELGEQAIGANSILRDQDDAGEDRETSEGNPARATLQMQAVVRQLHERGCCNIVVLTPARSRPHALSLFAGYEAQGRYPAYELGCCGSLPLKSPGTYGCKAVTAEPCRDLEPAVLMAEPDAESASRGMACAIVVKSSPNQSRAAGRDELHFRVLDGKGSEVGGAKLCSAV